MQCPKDNFTSLVDRLQRPAFFGFILGIAILLYTTRKDVPQLRHLFVFANLCTWSASWIVGALIAHKKRSHSLNELCRFAAVSTYGGAGIVWLILQTLRSHNWTESLPLNILLLLGIPVAAALSIRLPLKK